MGYPHPDLGSGTTFPHPDLGWGTPPVLTWEGGTPPGWPDGGTPLVGVDVQTPVKTLPSPFLRNAGGNKWCQMKQEHLVAGILLR